MTTEHQLHSSSSRQRAILDALRTILVPGQVTELRALDATTPNWKQPHTVSGYFNDPEKLAAEALTLTQSAKGVYFIPNVLNPALLARAANCTRNKGKATADSAVKRHGMGPKLVGGVNPSAADTTPQGHDTGGPQHGARGVHEAQRRPRDRAAPGEQIRV